MLRNDSFSQEDKDRVYEKYAVLTQLNLPKDVLKSRFTPEEWEMLMDSVQDRAIVNFDPVVAQQAFVKIAKATNGKGPKSNKELVELIEKHLEKDEIADFMGFLLKKNQDVQRWAKN